MANKQQLEAPIHLRFGCTKEPHNCSTVENVFNVKPDLEMAQKFGAISSERSNICWKNDPKATANLENFSEVNS